jgi:hypothetical protein
MTKLLMVVEAKFDGINWVDISSDVLTDPTCNSGIFGNGDADRVAGVGTFSFELKNSTANSAGLAGYYSPGHANCRTGFKIGLPIRVRYTFDGSSYTKWKGEIAPKGISVAPGIYGPRKTGVTCFDYMQQTIIHQLYLLAYTTNKTGDQVMNLILANMPKQPDSTAFDVGDYTYASVFDTVRTYTTAMAEFQKICQSERSYCYLRHNNTSDEILVWEDRTHRDSLAAVSEVIAPSSMCAPILDEDGFALLDEDGLELLSEGTMSVVLDDEMCELETMHGNNLFNRIVYTVYPKETFSGVLLTTQNRIALKAGETKTLIKLNYTDPAAKASKISCLEVTSVTSTLNAAQDGSGANLTANLTLTYVGASDSFQITSMTNASATDGFVYLQASGTGIRIYESISKITEDATSQLDYGTLELQINAPYQNDPVVADAFANIILAGSKQPYSEIKSATFICDDDTKKQLFLSTDIGARVHLSETLTGIDEDYFVQGWDFAVIGHNDNFGDVVKFTWYLKRAALDVYKFWKVGVLGSSEVGVTTVVGYSGS